MDHECSDPTTGRKHGQIAPWQVDWRIGDREAMTIGDLRMKVENADFAATRQHDLDAVGAPRRWMSWAESRGSAEQSLTCYPFRKTIRNEAGSSVPSSSKSNSSSVLVNVSVSPFRTAENGVGLP